MELQGLRDRASRVLDEVERAIVGKRDALELILLALLCNGHVLLEDYPGLAKTLAARSFAQATSLRFSRIQFTPDLMPSDVTGSSVFDQRNAEFTFLPGPIFTEGNGLRVTKGEERRTDLRSLCLLLFDDLLIRLLLEIGRASCRERV